MSISARMKMAAMQAAAVINVEGARRGAAESKVLVETSMGAVYKDPAKLVMTRNGWTTVGFKNNGGNPSGAARMKRAAKKRANKRKFPKSFK